MLMAAKGGEMPVVNQLAHSHHANANTANSRHMLSNPNHHDQKCSRSYEDPNTNAFAHMLVSTRAVRSVVCWMWS